MTQREARATRARTRRVRHYRQTTDFTCGPSSLLMAMNAQDGRVRLDRAEELAIWRESTMIFSGPKGRHGGCSALGLALAAQRRGFVAGVQCNHKGPLLIARAKKPQFQEIMRLLHARDLAEANARAIPVHIGELSIEDIAARHAAGFVPIVLNTMRYIHDDGTPHWVVVTGIDEGGVTLNDPWVAVDKGRSARDMTNVRVSRAVFAKMTHYGRAREQATVFIGPRA
jgi:predicted double-glycine peptidase